MTSEEEVEKMSVQVTSKEEMASPSTDKECHDILEGKPPSAWEKSENISF